MRVDVEVKDINIRGEGLVLIDNEEVGVRGALPGDRVVRGPDDREPRVLYRGAESALRCPHSMCPGCPLSRLPYPEQLVAKRRLVLRTFARAFEPDLLPPVEPTVPSPLRVGYRADAKLALARRGRGVSLGIYARGTHRVVDIPRCPVHHPLLAAGVRALRRLLGAAPTLAGGGPEAWLRYAAFRVSVAEGRLLLTLVTRTEEDRGGLGALAARLREAVPELMGVIWNVNPSPGNEIFGPEWRVVWGDPCIRERFGNHTLRASAASFLQANRGQASRLYQAATHWLRPQPGDLVLDLYCGAGGLTLQLAEKSHRVVGIEENPRAVADARAAVEAAGLDGARFEEGPVEDVLPRLMSGGLRPDLITLNPARKGIDPAVAEILRTSGARGILYVSCNPETLARDCALLSRGGMYRIERIRPVDFFPHTAHVETLALLGSSNLALPDRTL